MGGGCGARRNDQRSNMPAYSGTDRDDIYYGHETEADYVWVGDGNDTLLSGVGNTLIYAGSGDDFIIDDGGAFYADQKFDLGDGNDEVVLRGSGETDIYGKSGNDTYVLLRYYDVRAIKMAPADAIIDEEAGVACGIDTIKLSTGWSGFVMAANFENLIADNTNAQDDRITWDNKIDDTVLGVEVTGNADRKSTRLNSSHQVQSRMPSSA